MAEPVVLIFHRPARPEDARVVRLLAAARRRLVEQQSALWRRHGARDIRLIEAQAPSFGDLVRSVTPRHGGIVVMGSGALPRLAGRDVEQLVAAARSARMIALTNNRYSSDVCAIGRAEVLAELPALPSDNALPRWLEEKAGVTVSELAGRERLALDLDSPLDIGLWALARDAPGWARELARAEELAVPRRDELRSLAADPRRELMVFGRASSATLRWLEHNVRSRVRFLAEERGLRASSQLAIGGPPVHGNGRPPRATLGRLLVANGAPPLADLVSELADGAILDTRVLMADRFGPDEGAWPSPADRFASDLQRPNEIEEPWLRALTESATGSPLPIVLGAHTLVGPGIPLLLGGH